MGIPKAFYEEIFQKGKDLRGKKIKKKKSERK